jgi:hypothetical protein
VVSNLGGTPVSNGTATVTGGPYSIVSGGTFSLAGGGSTNVIVRFAPVSVGGYTNSVIFGSANGGASTNTVTGTGCAATTAIAAFAGITRDPLEAAAAGLAFFGRLVACVSLLPEELRRPEKGPGDLFPADDVGPLVDEDGQVPPGLDPLRVHGVDNGLARRAEGEPDLKGGRTAMRHPVYLVLEPLDMLRLFHEFLFGNQQREERFLVVAIEKVAEALVHMFSQCKPVRYQTYIPLTG